MGCVTTQWTCWQCTPVTTLTVDNNQIFIQSFEGFLKNHAKFCMAEITRVGHTSTSCQAGAKERFQQITEAYEALKACIRQSRVGCQLEPFDSIFCLTKESESNSTGNRWPIGFSLGTLPRASADDERPARVKGICDDFNNFNPLFLKLFLHFLFLRSSGKKFVANFHVAKARISSGPWASSAPKQRSKSPSKRNSCSAPTEKFSNPQKHV